MASGTDSEPRQRTSLHRDNQQWAFDLAIKETGRVYHFQPDGRGELPPSVRSHAMISKHQGQAAARLERLARAEAEAGHALTACEIYYRAALQFMAAQHTVFATNAEKRHLHSSLLRCFDQVRELSPTVIEHVDVPWEGTKVSGNLHLAPVDGPAPTIFFIPGCDVTKEAWPNPLYNQALQRGMHVFSFDGPGQGESNLRDLALTADNYERAASAAIDYLLGRPEVDATRLAVYGISFGSYWGLRLAATDHRVSAVAAPWATYCDLDFLMTQESPRFKQLFAYLTRAKSEAELDEITAQMTLDGLVGEISCPALLVTGEYDPRSPIEEVYRIFDQMGEQTELWVFPDQFHHTSVTGGGRRGLWEADVHSTVCDWLADRVAGQPQRHPGEVVYVDNSRGGPNGPDVQLKRHWYES